MSYKLNSIYIAKGQYNYNVRFAIYKLLEAGPIDVYVEHYDIKDKVDNVIRITCECLADWIKYEERLSDIFKGNLEHIKFDPIYIKYNNGEVSKE